MKTLLSHCRTSTVILCVALLAACSTGSGPTTASSGAGETSAGSGSDGETRSGGGAGSTDGEEPESGGGANPGGPGSSVQPYEAFDSCDGFISWTKDQLLARLTPYGIDPYGAIGWRERIPMPAMEDSMVTEAAAAETAAPAAEAPAAADMSVEVPAAVGGTSTTNTQEVGVDEGDISETDGRFVYSVIDGVLRSVDLQTSELLAETPLDASGGAQEMILFGDTLLITSAGWMAAGQETVASRYSLAGGIPTLLSTTHLEGWPISIRAVDGVARLTLSTSIISRIEFVQPRFADTDDEDQALERNTEIVEALTPDDLLPRSYERSADGTRGPVAAALDCSVVGHPGAFGGFGLTWVASLDLTDSGSSPQGTGGIIADGQTVYVSTDHLYIAAQNGLWPEIDDGLIPVQPDDPATSIHMFDIGDPARTTYLASGVVDGALLNSYSMSEFDGHLRVATTEYGSGFGSGQDSGIHVLGERFGELVEVGAVRGLGANEDIQAVRFHGPIGYVVTFRRTDPLFVVDLSDPTSPRLTGELKIPGYSSYLHPIGDGLLLGVGFTGDESGLTGGSQLSLFDVTDPSDPTLLATSELGGVTEAAFDPHAFLWWPETSDVILPREMVCEIGQRDECSTAVVIHVDIPGRTLIETDRLFQWFPVVRTMVVSGDLVTLSAGGLKQWSFAGFDELADIRFDIPNTTAEETLP